MVLVMRKISYLAVAVNVVFLLLYNAINLHYTWPLLIIILFYLGGIISISAIFLDRNKRSMTILVLLSFIFSIYFGGIDVIISTAWKVTGFSP